MGEINKLTQAEEERLYLLLEELGEAQQAIGKILRHGYESHHPRIPEVSNRDNLEREIGDIGVILEMMTDSGDLDMENIEKHAIIKKERLLKYLYYQ